MTWFCLGLDEHAVCPIAMRVRQSEPAKKHLASFNPDVLKTVAKRSGSQVYFVHLMFELSQYNNILKGIFLVLGTAPRFLAGRRHSSCIAIAKRNAIAARFCGRDRRTAVASQSLH